VGKTNPNKPKVKIGKMNVTPLITMNYEQRTMNCEKNKAKQSQSNPIPPARYAIRNTRYEIQTQPVVSLPALLVLRSIGEGGSIVEVSNLFQRIICSAGPAFFAEKDYKQIDYS